MTEEEVPEEEWVAAQESWDDYDWNCILLKRDNDRLRELLSEMHAAYVYVSIRLRDCVLWDYSLDDVERQRLEDLPHRFDDAMKEIGAGA